MGMKPTEYPFPAALEQTGYLLFPAEMESDPNTFFHGTAEKNLAAILQEGFKSGPDLQSVSYSRTSSLSLAYACKGRSPDSPLGVVIAVRFEFLDKSGYVEESFGLHVNDPALQPQVVAYCIVPVDYRHA
jgi:hypothetical protein